MSSFFTNPPDPNRDRRLVCFPHSGGGSARFFTWARLMPDRFQVLPILLPGREGRYREAPYARLDRLVADLIPAVRPYLEVPYGFFGTSLGAFIGFELAREIRRRRWRQPEAFFVCAAPPPDRRAEKPFLHRMNDDELLHRIRERYGGIPREILKEKELLDIYLRIIRADFEMIETYLYKGEEPFDFPILAFGGNRDDMVGEADLAGWRRQTSGRFAIEMMPGDHFFINKNQNLLLHRIEAILSVSPPDSP